MFNSKPVDPQLDEAIDSVYTDLKGFHAQEDAHATVVDQLSALYKLKEQNTKSKVSADTIAIVSGNILGIILIVGHERAHVVTSKAMQFIKAAR